MHRGTCYQTGGLLDSKQALVMETSVWRRHLLACHIQAKQASKKTMPASVPEVNSDVVIKKKDIKNIKQCEVIDVENPCEDNVDPMNTIVYKDAVSNTRTYTS